MVNYMDVRELVKLINGVVLTSNCDLSRVVNGCCGADLMSDVLATIQPDAVLLTGLCNPQVVRTAQIADVTAIVLARGKMPVEETIALAQAENIPLISTPLGMYEACGRLYVAGLGSKENIVKDQDCTSSHTINHV